ncbi:MAG: hypothetical protein RL557_865 [archaeon]|jgi:hypothetical protein
MMKRVNVERRFIMRVVIILIILLILLFFARRFTGRVIGIDAIEGVSVDSVDGDENGAGGSMYIEESLASLASGLPPDASVLFEIYSYDNGEMIILDHYAIVDGYVREEKIEDAGVFIQIHSKYFSEEGEICSLIQRAMHNGDADVVINDRSVFSLSRYQKLIACMGM